MTDHRPGHDVLDEALDLLAPYGPEWLNGLASHGPMTAEAMLRMDRPDAVLPWTERYVRRLEPAPAPGLSLTDDEWPDALGRRDRYADWWARFRNDLTEQPWELAVAQWTPVLLTGLWGAAGHGVIRAAHAVRALGDHDSPQRLDELARGLAYWAAQWQPLPGDATLTGSSSLDAAMAAVKGLTLPETGGWLITEILGPIDEVVGFPEAVAALGPVTVSDLTAAFARVYLANAEHAAIPLVHAVTAPTALRSLLPLLPPEQHRGAVGDVWRACAALLLGFGTVNAAPIDPDAPHAPGLAHDELADRAVASGDEHAIKLTEACLREHAIAPDPAYLAAAADACDRLRDDQ